MAVTDTWAGWSTAAASNSPVGGATPEIDDEFRNIKAEVKANAMALSGAQTVAGVKTFSEHPIFSNATAVTADSQGAHKAYVDSADTAYIASLKGAANGLCGLDASTLVAVANLGTGASTNTYLRGDQSFQLPDNPLIILRHKLASGTHPGGQTSGSWATRTLNEELVDTDSLCSLSSNQFTLAAGTYEIYAVAPFWSCDQAQIRLYNVSDSSVEVYGGSVFAVNDAAYHNHTHSTLYSRFTLASEKVLRIESRVAYTNTTTGWGVACTFGGDEVYMQVYLRQVAS